MTNFINNIVQCRRCRSDNYTGPHESLLDVLGKLQFELESRINTRTSSTSICFQIANFQIYLRFVALFVSNSIGFDSFSLGNVTCSCPCLADYLVFVRFVFVSCFVLFFSFRGRKRKQHFCRCRCVNDEYGNEKSTTQFTLDTKHNEIN